MIAASVGCFSAAAIPLFPSLRYAQVPHAQVISGKCGEACDLCDTADNTRPELGFELAHIQVGSDDRWQLAVMPSVNDGEQPLVNKLRHLLCAKVVQNQQVWLYNIRWGGGGGDIFFGGPAFFPEFRGGAGTGT